MIRVFLEQFSDVSEHHRILVEALKGAGIKHKVVAERIANSLPPSDLSDLVKNRDSQRIVDQAGINMAQAVKVVETLQEHPVLFDLDVVELNDKPRIELKDGDT